MEYQKTTEATSDLSGNKITKVLQNSQPNNSETVTKNIIKKYLKKDIYLQKKHWKLVVIWD